MVAITMLKVMTLAMMMTFCRGQGQDATLVANSRGVDIVNSVVGKIRANCIYSEDRLFLRRTAYVMSRDGTESFTYRPGFDGGIWQITEAMFLSTQDCSLSPSTIAEACSNIRTNLGIDWPSVAWADLRKPLYSGLAAALYALRKAGSSGMPGDVAGQAQVWGQMYSEPGATFATEAVKAPVFECKDKLDLVFILDSSGSVSYSDFILMRNFTASVVEAMNVSQSSVRIADIVYGSRVRVYFDFEGYSSKADAKSRLLQTTKLGGSTNTASALNEANRILYDFAGSGARQNVKKVAVLITDGRSNSRSLTQSAATALKDSGTTAFAIGVGNYNILELRAIASDPICSHVLTLTGFDKIDSIITEIQKSTCEANYRLPSNTGIGGELTDDPTETTAVAPAPGTNKTIKATVSCGVLQIYVSTTDPKPGPSVFEDLYTALPGRPAFLRAVESLPAGLVVYITVVGVRLPASVAASLKNCSDHSWTLGVAEKTDTEVVCKENGVERPCTQNDLGNTGLCPADIDLSYLLENPCTQENLDQGNMRHPYPFDPTKFLQCDMKGQYYITLCPGAVIFNPSTGECGFNSPGTQASVGGGPGNNGTQFHQVVTPAPVAGNPLACSSRDLAKGIYFQPHPQDPSKFIQCDSWGTPYVMLCSPGTVWSQTAYTCVLPTSAGTRSVGGNSTPASAVVTTPVPAPAAASTAPCTHGEYYENPCDPESYYQCVGDQKVEMRCYHGLHFNIQTKVCDWPSASPSPVPANCP